MKIESIFTDKEGYRFKIDNSIILEISGTAISTLGIILPPSGQVGEFYKNIIDQFDIEKMMGDLQNKNSKIRGIIIDSKVCHIDGAIDPNFQINDLKKYKR